MVFDSKDAEARHRETPVLLVLSHAADAFNNQEVQLRLEEMVQGTQQLVTYKTHSIAENATSYLTMTEEKPTLALTFKGNMTA